LTALVLHHVALVIELFQRQGIRQRRQAVGFQPENLFQIAGGHGRKVVCAVLARRAVDAAFKEVCARRLDV
jgi:hypothetical protein